MTSGVARERVMIDTPMTDLRPVEQDQKSQPLLSTRNLRKAYGEMVALEGLDLDVRSGECVALIGHNGSGKTTALRLAAGRLESTGGEILVAGEDLASKADSPAARKEIALVSDEPVLYDDLTVSEHLELVGLSHGVTEGLDERIEALLETFGLEAYRGLLPGQLSRGLKQKTQLVCSLIRPFSVLMLDEPVVGLDPGSQKALHRTLLETKTGGAGILLATHQLAFAEGLADRAVVLQEGRVVAGGLYEEIATGERAASLGLA